MLKHLAMLIILVSIHHVVVAQSHTTFQGSSALEYNIAPDLSVFAVACKHGDEEALCFDVSYTRIASGGRRALILGALAGVGYAGANGTNVGTDPLNTYLDEDPHNGRLYVTATKVAFVPSLDARYAWIADRTKLAPKHSVGNGEEVADETQKLHGFVNFQPYRYNGQPAWTDGSSAKVLVAKKPKDNAEAFLNFFYEAVNSFDNACSKLKD